MFILMPFYLFAVIALVERFALLLQVEIDENSLLGCGCVVETENPWTRRLVEGFAFTQQARFLSFDLVKDLALGNISDCRCGMRMDWSYLPGDKVKISGFDFYNLACFEICR